MLSYDIVWEILLLQITERVSQVLDEAHIFAQANRTNASITAHNIKLQEDTFLYTYIHFLKFTKKVKKPKWNTKGSSVKNKHNMPTYKLLCIPYFPTRHWGVNDISLNFGQKCSVKNEVNEIRMMQVIQAKKEKCDAAKHWNSPAFGILPVWTVSMIIQRKDTW